MHSSCGVRSNMTGAEFRLESDPRIGRPVDELDTPTLLLDRAASDRNLAKMAAFFRDRPAKLRPHFKNHKCATLAKRQLAAGSAIGITCAKLGEAEILVEHGIDNVLIANQVVGEAKVARLARLATRAHVGVAVDHIDQAAAISRAASAVGSTVHLLIEVDIGMGRCGVAPGAAALDLARRLADFPVSALPDCRPTKGISSTCSIAPSGRPAREPPCNWRLILVG